MCDLIKPAGFWLGFGLEAGGLILLVNGLIALRKRIDPSYQGFWPSFLAGLDRQYQKARSTMRRLLRKHGEVHSGTASGTIQVTSSATGRVTVSPNWSAEPGDLIRRVFDILGDRIEEQRKASEEQAKVLNASIESESRKRETADTEIRDALTEASLGGLGKEALAVTLIFLGLTATFVTTLCAF